MAAQDKGRPLPKFGEWDVNNPASADGFTVIFAKARDDKKSSGTAASAAKPSSQRNIPKPNKYPPPVCLTFLSATITIYAFHFLIDHINLLTAEKMVLLFLKSVKWQPLEL
ncbi:RPM1-interacting protein 4-like [Mangifera indica]|uniref:RPM1-interacting protein 4-like n=1 Tax=Mangifera indica TaxID=29780 RepID=UPI001CF959D1|nr:RPM1-interacting protein 4-like [Mangifera indica]